MSIKSKKGRLKDGKDQAESSGTEQKDSETEQKGSETERKDDMKKIMLAAMMIMAMLMIAGCGDDQTGNSIKQWQPQDKKAEAVLQMLTTGENYSVGEFKVGSKLKSVKFGYDYYNKDKLIKDCKCGGLENKDGDETDGIVGVCLRGGKYRAFNTKEGSGGGAVDGDLEGWEKGDSAENSFAGLENEKSFESGEKCYIAAYVSGGSSLADPDTMLKEKEIMKKNDKTWLFYVIFEEDK